MEKGGWYGYRNEGTGGGNLLVFKICICFSIIQYTLYFFLLYSKLYFVRVYCTVIGPTLCFFLFCTLGAAER